MDSKKFDKTVTNISIVCILADMVTEQITSDGLCTVQTIELSGPVSVAGRSIEALCDTLRNMMEIHSQRIPGQTTLDDAEGQGRR